MQTAAVNVDRAAHDVAGDSIAEFVIRMDRRQSNPLTAKHCPKVKKGDDHGALGVGAGGSVFMCGQIKCDHREPISRGEYDKIDRNGLLAHEDGYEALRPAEAGGQLETGDEPVGSVDELEAHVAEHQTLE